ncbi:MAG: xanthine dehydrogenase family protein molybdopterin-binding subunit, partial [Candidatus Dormibacteraeota bacterium]|nr:xanthine dehydrogenase family protein molybdopterin-binding subunit [Candidatus Dormibacteraeota bacterium]
MITLSAGAKRLDGPDKLRGETRFTQDHRLVGMLHLRPVLSPYACARIVAVDGAAARALPGVVGVLTAADLPELDVAGPDRPLAAGKVYFAGQPVAVVAAETEAAAADAAALVQVEYEELAAVVDPFAAMEASAPQVLEARAEGFDDVSIHGGGAAEAEPQERPRNVSSVAAQRRGDAAAALAAAEVVVGGRYVMPGAHQGFLEPHVVVVAPEAGGRVTIWSPTQGHHFVREEVAKTLGLEPARVRVVAMPVGGGFGGKVVLLEPLAVLVARHFGRPVQLALTRTEEFLLGRPAPASHTDLKLGSLRDGTLTALQVEVVWDNGAASGWHGGFANRLFDSPYEIPAFAYRAYEVSTNKTPVDAYRAPSGTQTFFALESAMDELARELGLDPIELRLRNARTHLPGADGGEPARVGLVEVLRAARSHPLYTAPRPAGTGLGVAVGGWGGAVGAAAAGCRVEPDGSLTVTVGTPDISGS